MVIIFNFWIDLIVHLFWQFGIHYLPQDTMAGNSETITLNVYFIVSCLT